MEQQTSRMLGQYELLEVVGRGSTATVYRAYQPSLGRYVAVKVLNANLDPQFASRFEREAQAVAQLHHPNILPIYDYGEYQQQRYFVTQYIPPGHTLGDLMAGAAVEPLAAFGLMLHILDALDYAHQRGVIHRDIKPSNILLPRPDWPLLADFGIAKLLDESTRLTPPGQAVGTAAYMAPERALDRPADARTDLYAVGVVLYQMLTGRVPFTGPTPAAVLMQHVHDPVPPPSSINPSLPPFVEDVVLRALRKNPDDRYQSAPAMAEDMRRVIRRLERESALAGMFAAPGATPVDRYKTGKLPEPSEPLEAPEAAPRRAGLSPFGRGFALAMLVGGIVGLALLWRVLSGPAPSATGTAARQPATAGQAATAPAAAATVVPPSAAPATEGGPAPTALAAAAGPPTLSAGNTVIRLDDTAWSGGYGGAGGRARYGGRSATWVYGEGSGLSSMEARFEVAEQPDGVAELTIEGMDSEGRAKTEISISVNGNEIYRGPNPLPDDDLPLETGTWASHTWTFDARLLRRGANVLRISNRSPGQFSLPPFFMLDYADLTLAAK